MIVLTGCSTYHISIESFKTQFNGLDSTKLREVTISGPFGGRASYLANPIDTIYCMDDDNKQIKMVNKPSIEIRFTYNNDDRTIFYFDTIFLQDSLIVGSKSRFIPSLRDAIPLNTVKLIELQDGKKDFNYVKE